MAYYQSAFRLTRGQGYLGKPEGYSAGYSWRTFTDIATHGRSNNSNCLMLRKLAHTNHVAPTLLKCALKIKTNPFQLELPTNRLLIRMKRAPYHEWNQPRQNVRAMCSINYCKQNSNSIRYATDNIISPYRYFQTAWILSR